MRCAIAGALLLWCGAVGRAQEAAESAGQATLTACADVRGLSAAEAAEGRSVRVRGVVTLLPPLAQLRNRVTFVVDDGEGIWVSPPQRADLKEAWPQLRVGDEVEVVGHTLDGRFSPTILGEQVRRLGRAALPAPREVTLLGLNSGQYDCQRITLGGVVQAAELRQAGGYQELRLKVQSALGVFSYSLLTIEPQPVDGLVDAEVTVTGVCLSFFNSRRQFLGARLQSNEPADLQIDVPGGDDPFAAREVLIEDAMAFSPEGRDLHRRTVRGVVTLSRAGSYFYLQDGPHALRVNTRQAEGLAPGDLVEAAGFLQLEHHRAEMHEAVFRWLGHEAAPRPIEITRDQAFTREPQMAYAAEQDFDDVLVAMRGELVSFDQKDGEPLRLNLQCDGTLVPAEFVGEVDSDALAALLPGSELRVTGVCVVTFSASRPVVEWPQPVAVQLLVRGLDDVTVLRPASPWTTERLTRLLLGTVVVLAAAFGWIVSLRRTVATRSQELAQEMRARRDAAVEFESSMRERNRLAADLHDTMEQSLTGLALQLEASETLQQREDGRARVHLGLARQLLGRSREDLRRSIWNLRANPLERQTLFEALEQIAADRSAEVPVSIVAECEGEPRDLPDFVAGNMLLLAQEGITNALKHAGAQLIRLHLRFAPGTVTLTITDDGKGFDPTAVVGPKQGHFGLQGMRERTKRLGGSLRINSEPGRGCTITATVKD